MMDPLITIPQEVKIKVNLEQLQALHRAIENYLFVNPIEYPIYFIDLFVFNHLIELNRELEKLVLKCRHSGAVKAPIRFSFFQLMITSNLIKPKRGDTFPLRSILELIAKEAFKYDHLIVFGNEENEEKEGRYLPPSSQL